MTENNIHPDINDLIGKNILFIDLETNGFPGKTNDSEKYDRVYEDLKKYGSSRIVQIGYCYYEKFDPEFEPSLDDISSVIVLPRKPNNFALKNSHIHGITRDDIKNNGIALCDIINGGLGKYIMSCDYIIAYNIAFDGPILASELFRISFQKKYKKVIDLMDNDKMFCMGKLSGKICSPENSKSFMPKQKDVYKQCYGIEPDNQHDAKGDVYTMIKILKYMIDNKILETKTHCKQNTIALKKVGMPWTKEEDACLIREYVDDGLSSDRIASMHGRTNGSIASRIKKLNIDVERKYIGLTDKCTVSPIHSGAKSDVFSGVISSVISSVDSNEKMGVK